MNKHTAMLFPDADPLSPERTLILTSSHTIFPLFTRGCLLPAILEQGAEESPPGMISGTIPTYIGQLPSNWVGTIETSARNVIPIAVSLHSESEIRTISSHGHEVPFVTLSDVHGLHFRNQEELERFASWTFEDVNMSQLGIPTDVRAEFFSGPTTALPEELDVNNPAVTLIKKALRRADMYCGLLACALQTAGADKAQLEAAMRLLELRLDATEAEQYSPLINVGRTLLGMEESSTSEMVDAALVTATVESLEQYPSRLGWPAKEVLEQIRSNVLDRFPAGSDEAEYVDQWAFYTRKALSASTRPQLTDAGSIVRRALMLLLLRGDPRALNDDGEVAETQEIGTAVRKLAFELAGARYGLRALPHKIKMSNMESAKDFLSAAGNLVAIILARSVDALPREVPPARLTYSPESEYQGHWEIHSGTKLLRRIPALMPPGLRKVAEDCRYYGFQVTVEDSFLVMVEGHTAALSCPVEVSFIGNRSHGEKVRFTCRTSTLGVKPRKHEKKLSFDRAINKTNRKNLMRLLLHNANTSTHCRIAIDPETYEVIVIEDQLIGTMDRDECIAHLRNVSAMVTELHAAGLT